jgi:hypothetical protein
MERKVRLERIAADMLHEQVTLSRTIKVLIL